MAPKRILTTGSAGSLSLLREIIGVLSAAAAAALVLSFFGFAGVVGATIATWLFSRFGWLRWGAPVLFLCCAVRSWAPRMIRPRVLQFAGVLLVFAGLWIGTALVSPLYAGSIANSTLLLASRALGRSGVWVLTLVFLLVGFTLTLTVAVSSLVLSSVAEIVRRGVVLARWLFHRLRNRRAPPLSDRADDHGEVSTSSNSDDEDPSLFERRALVADGATPASSRPIRVRLNKARGTFQPTFPIALLDSGDSQPQAGDISGTQTGIRETFENFGIGVEMAEVSVGPTVTQYTLKPATGVKVSQIMALQNDLSLALAAHPIRIEAPIPGRSLVGIEVPNRRVALVGLRDLLSSELFVAACKSTPDSLICALGKDVSGTPFIGRLDRMPHLLIAGATGSGKTVAINILLTSLLYTKRPEDLKLLLIDPKRVELPAYNGIPHLIAPVITDLKKTITALKWVLREMDRRFTLLAQAGRRDIGSYNSNGNEPLPYLVVVIDELADLMVAAASEVEASIIRIAQMARAVGIHLIVATQRPSVDVLTGLIKANMTTRLAFSVASGVDSRTILDTTGAEKLLGRGDCLFVSSELSKPKRLQGAFVSEGEIQRIVAALCELGTPEYVEVTSQIGSGSGDDRGYGDDLGSSDRDPLLDEAVNVIRQAGRASASLLQRRLKIGYARAARILDLLEARGIVGPGEGAKPRDILIAAADHGMLDENGSVSVDKEQIEKTSEQEILETSETSTDSDEFSEDDLEQ